MSFCICMALLVAGIEPADGNEAAKANNAFAVDLYKQLSAGEGNLFFSPLSISSALAMAHAGAAGNTADEMAKVLHLDGVTDVEIGALVQEFNSNPAFDNGGRLEVANALWLDKKFKFLKSYTQTVQEEFQAELFRVNFRRKAFDTRLEINRWGKEKTAGRIPELIAEGQVDSLTRLVLTNAIHFRGKWAKEFDPSSTENKSFRVTPERETTVPMMNQKGDFLYLEGEDFQVVHLYYRSGLVMLIALPNAVDGLKALEERLTAEQLAEWMTLAAEREVVLSLPKFSSSSEFDLKNELAKLGMTDAFQEGAADFSRMINKPDVCIKAVLHKAWVDVDEKGTEAAALTAVAVSAMGMVIDPPPPIIFNADHPFLYAICNWKTGAVLFLGRMVNPTAR